MIHCPKCQSRYVARSRSKTRWERWRKQITGKRLYRCRVCRWRGWLENLASMTRDAGSMAPDPPNLKGTRLAREDRRLQLDLKTLDEFDRVPDKADAR